MSDDLDCFELSLHTMFPWGAPLELTEAKYPGYERAKLHAFNLSWSATHITNAVAVDFPRNTGERPGRKISYAVVSYDRRIVAIAKLSWAFCPPPGAAVRFEPLMLSVTRIEQTEPANGYA